MHAHLPADVRQNLMAILELYLKHCIGKRFLNDSLDLDHVFARAPSGTDRRRLVVVRCDGLQIGLIVDDIVGQHQTVIKTFSAYHRGVEGLSGATILGDGTVALIIDVASLARRAVAEARIAIEAA